MKYLLILGLLISSLGLSAQQSKLAAQYFSDGEYEKAASVYQKLYEKNNHNFYYFDKYVECLISLEAYDECESAIKKAIRKNSNNIQLYVSYGNLYEQQFMPEKAEEKYKLAIKKMPKDKYQVTRLANSFIKANKYDYAVKTYEQGIKILEENSFAYNLGDLYKRKGDVPKMIGYYLESLEQNPGRINSLKTIFQRSLSVDDFDELQAQLYDKIDTNNTNIEYIELLTWVFIQKKDYQGAMRQAKALDRQLSENGGRIMRLSDIAFNDKDYSTAISGYEFVVQNKGITSTYYLDAKRKLLKSHQSMVLEKADYTQEDLLQLEKRYLDFLDEFGSSKLTAPIIYELANFEAFYLNNLDKAIGLLKELVGFPGVEKHILAENKLALGDFYLMKGDRWEATLLYSQVDKDFEDNILGHEARFKNAQLSYYNADFEWAQAQFDILKASTSKLISNDAIDLSVFIMDNMGLDTNIIAMKYYAEAELLTFQNRYDEAFTKLDSLTHQFSEHPLVDDILYEKAQIYTKKREYTKAVDLYTQIIEKHFEEIRADNAMFHLAELYENQLNDSEKAKALYERLFMELSNSTLAVEARKRFRRLRGDVL